MPSGQVQQPTQAATQSIVSSAYDDGSMTSSMMTFGTMNSSLITSGMETSSIMTPEMDHDRDYAVGDQVEYYTGAWDKWVPSKITIVDKAGRVQIGRKPGTWMDASEQETKLRRPRKEAGAGG